MLYDYSKRAHANSDASSSSRDVLLLGNIPLQLLSLCQSHCANNPLVSAIPPLSQYQSSCWLMDVVMTLGHHGGMSNRSPSYTPLIAWPDSLSYLSAPLISFLTALCNSLPAENMRPPPRTPMPFFRIYSEPTSTLRHSIPPRRLPISPSNFIALSYQCVSLSCFPASCFSHQIHHRPSPCSGFCRYRMCREVGSMLFPQREDLGYSIPPFGSLMPFSICKSINGSWRFLRNMTLGEAEVALSRNVTSSQYQPISSFSRRSLIHSFPEHVFFSLKRKSSFQEEGVSIVPLLRDQYDSLSSLCVRLPVLQYQKHLHKRGTFTQLKKRNKHRAEECLEFRSMAPELYIKLQWAGGHDLDLAVQEPNGYLIDRFSPVSLTGGYKALDNGWEYTCQINRSLEWNEIIQESFVCCRAHMLYQSGRWLL